MKFLIYAGGLILESTVLVLLSYAGVSAPILTVALFAAYIFGARYLCKKWDNRKSKKSSTKEETK